MTKAPGGMVIWGSKCSGSGLRGQEIQCGERSSPNTHKGQLSPALIEAFTQRPESRLASQSLPMSLKKEVPLRNVNKH